MREPPTDPLDKPYRTTDRTQVRGRICGSWTHNLYNRQTGEVRVVQFRCKSWDCEFCGPRKREKLISDINQAGTLYDLRTFFTLTLPGEWHKGGRHRESTWNGKEADEALKYLRACWSKLRKRLARAIAEFQYVVVVEGHKDGTPHLHGLCSSGLDGRRLRAMAREVGLGRMVDVSDAPIRRIARYVAKYLGKGSDRLPKGARRYSCSRGVLLHPPRDRSWTGSVLDDTGREVWGPHGADHRHQAPVDARVIEGDGQPRWLRRVRVRMLMDAFGPGTEIISPGQSPDAAASHRSLYCCAGSNEQGEFQWPT